MEPWCRALLYIASLMEGASQADSKKCRHCGQWSVHRGQPDDRCEHCHELLDPSAPGQAADLLKAWNWQMPQIMLIDIDPADAWPLRMLKYLVRGGQMLFIATISFIVWLVTVVAG
jgi:hypothetical protein